MSQREMMREMNISLGKINYCVSKLAEKGMIKVERFKDSKKKFAYVYKLTPQGIEELARLTFDFLKQKIREHDEIKKEIEILSGELCNFDYNQDKESEVLYLQHLAELTLKNN